MVVQSRRQGCLVNEWAACRIDQECRGLHQSERTRIDDGAGLIRERAVERDDIALSEQFIDLQKRHASHRFATVSRGGHDFHAERTPQFRHTSANGSVADNAEGQSVELDERLVRKTEIGALAPRSAGHAPGVVSRAVGQFQD
jgi:hypothetical protein